jgi:hypothetical protein
LGARGYVVKPFHPEEIKHEIERVIGAAHVGVDDAGAAPAEVTHAE